MQNPFLLPSVDLVAVKAGRTKGLAKLKPGIRRETTGQITSYTGLAARSFAPAPACDAPSES
jgi:hypothetical protein